MIGIKYDLPEQLHYKSFKKCLKIDITDSICGNVNSNIIYIHILPEINYIQIICQLAT